MAYRSQFCHPAFDNTWLGTTRLGPNALKIIGVYQDRCIVLRFCGEIPALELREAEWLELLVAHTVAPRSPRVPEKMVVLPVMADG
jgi:hypothetical protein